ncbi:hypothetical protein IAQ61_009250 [Plenodomus lingam]|uniref:uncharacterized protein n=1 Tax=Leptosphaeria maculans TaxID=5022 RepID=UPI00331D95EE|nr:hypothetical protein IAQ61_009250 [Plenodomus lingam]
MPACNTGPPSEPQRDTQSWRGGQLSGQEPVLHRCWAPALAHVHSLSVDVDGTFAYFWPKYRQAEQLGVGQARGHCHH